MGNLTIPSKDINNTLSKAYQTLSRYDSFDYKSAVAAQPVVLSKKGNMDLFRYLKQKFLNLYLLINIIILPLLLEEH